LLPGKYESIAGPLILPLFFPFVAWHVQICQP
jgi:hypothetical protein